MFDPYADFALRPPIGLLTPRGTGAAMGHVPEGVRALADPVTAHMDEHGPGCDRLGPAGTR